jgi:hypothetical protein
MENKRYIKLWFGYPVRFAEIWLMLLLMLICCERKTLSMVYGPIRFAEIWSTYADLL